jgi:hypothetical protein
MRVNYAGHYQWCLVKNHTIFKVFFPYDYNYEIPDYDYFTPDPLTLAKELATIYSKKGFNDVEAKSWVHHGTYKVFVNFIPVADITYINKTLYHSIENTLTVLLQKRSKNH